MHHLTRRSLACSFLCAMAAASAMAETDIPRARAHVDVIGSTSALQVSNLIAISAKDAQRGGPRGDFHLAWQGDALLVTADIEDATPAAADSDATLWTGDCVELFLGRLDKPEYRFQVLCAPDYSNPSQTKLQIIDSRSAGMASPKVKVTRTPRENGYRLNFTVPLAELGLRGERNVRFRLQLAVDAVEGKERKQYVWYPSGQSSRDGNATHVVRLGNTTDDRFDIAAIAEYRGFRDLAVVVNAPARMTGRRVRVERGDRTLAETKLVAMGNRSAARLLLPMPAAAETYGCAQVRVDGEEPQRLVVPPLPDLQRAVDELPLRPQRGIFWETTFPSVALPADAEDVLGLYSIKTTYYDADLNPVTEAAKPGRYAAVARITSASGQTFTRYCGLYRAPQKLNMDWFSDPLPLQVQLPPEFGIDPQVIAREQRLLADVFTSSLRRQMGEDEEVAMVLAALAEMKTPGETSVGRTGPWGRAEDYFARLRIKLEDYRYPYAVSLPSDYKQGEGRPLLVFLHGAGERGRDITRLENNLVVKNVRGGNLPFIVVSPQCAPGDWWNATFLDRLLEEVAAKYSVDPDRIYITGLSMGGFGSWTMAHRYPERFAAVAPICGIGDRFDMQRLSNLPLWVFHGDKDLTVPIGPDEKCVETLRNAGGRVRFTVYPGVGHDSWTQTYNNPEFYKWLLEQKRGEPRQPRAAVE